MTEYLQKVLDRNDICYKVHNLSPDGTLDTSPLLTLIDDVLAVTEESFQAVKEQQNAFATIATRLMLMDRHILPEAYKQLGFSYESTYTKVALAKYKDDDVTSYWQKELETGDRRHIIAWLEDACIDLVECATMNNLYKDVEEQELY